MKKTVLPILFFLLVTGSVQAQYQNWAVGFRVGEPSGVNVRKYFGTNHAFDVNIGTYGGLYGNGRAYRAGRYKSVGLAIQGHYLWHTELFNRPEFMGYYGFGGQINVRNYFPDNLANQPVNNVSETSLGGSGVAGVEYFVPSKAYSVFLETGLYLELLPVPFYVNIQSGLGLRFNF
jgi:hypothetical protein